MQKRFPAKTAILWYTLIMESRGLILLVHGSKNPEWLIPFESLAREVGAVAKDAYVSIACLQSCEPTLANAIKEQGQRGIAHIIIAPFFISARGHVLKDVPVVVEGVKQMFPHIEITVTDAIGEQYEVREGMRKSLLRILGGE